MSTYYLVNEAGGCYNDNKNNKGDSYENSICKSTISV